MFYLYIYIYITVINTYHHGVLVFRKPSFISDESMGTLLFLKNLNDFNGHLSETSSGALNTTTCQMTKSRQLPALGKSMHIGPSCLSR